MKLLAYLEVLLLIIVEIIIFIVLFIITVIFFDYTFGRVIDRNNWLCSEIALRYYRWFLLCES
jgi:hypothetical protein